jgi:lysophospholipase L1-like esterase
MAGALRYVALGDSYTIGTSVSEPERFPNQLVAALGGGPPGLELIANLGVNGYTSADLIRDELPRLADLAPDFVTLCIGVNDVVQGVPTPAIAQNVGHILDAVLAAQPAAGVVVVTIPDYTVTPAGTDYGAPAARSSAIRAANDAIARLAAERAIDVVDVHPTSLLAATDHSLVATDGLHPSGRQYARWVELLVPVVRRHLID